MKPIVVTGARGYIGSALVQRLAGEGHALRLVSRSAPNAGAGGEPAYVEADLRDEAAWLGLTADAGAIVHLSSRTDLRAAEADPAGDHAINVEPMRALVRAAGRRGVALPVIFASTVTIVGDMHANPVNEQTPDRPCSVYDRHKLECETILAEATRRGVLRACSIRLSNVYGFGTASINSNRGIFNMVMRRAREGQPLAIYGEGAYVRDFVFLGDVVDAFCRALAVERVQDGHSYVIASGTGHTLLAAFNLVADEVQRRTGHRVEIGHVPEPADLHPIERRSFVGDSRLFAELTGWRARVDLPSGISDYLDRAVASSGGARLDGAA